MKNYIKAIEIINDLKKIEDKTFEMFSEKFREENFDFSNPITSMAYLTIGMIIDADFNKFYKKCSKRNGTERGIGWTNEGFVPDLMFSYILRDQVDPKVAVKEIKRLYKKVK